jgi:hypothetical protein
VPETGTGSFRPVIEHVEGALPAARLSVHRRHDTATGGPVFCELCYGGVRIATGVIAAGERALELDVPALEDHMDDFALTVRAWSEGGETVAVQATCARPPARLTRAEVAARSLWPGARGQLEVPKRGEELMAERRLLSVTQPAKGAGPGRRVSRPVVLYQDVHRLLAARRRRLEDAPRKRDVPPRDLAP